MVMEENGRRTYVHNVVQKVRGALSIMVKILLEISN